MSIVADETSEPEHTPETLADVMSLVEHDPRTRIERKRELCSALRTASRAIGKDLATIPCEPRQLRALLSGVSPKGVALSDARWTNVCSLLRRALRLAGVRTMPGRARDPLSREWETLRSLLHDRHAKLALSRLMSWCTTNGTSPEAVDQGIFKAFHQAIEETSLGQRDPGGLYRDACKVWNVAADTIPEWPKLKVEVPDRRRRFSLGLDAFPPSFAADVESYLAKGGEPDIFSDDYCKPARPITLKGRRQNILKAATALVNSGFPSDRITSLSQLVEAENAKAALRYLHDRAGRKKSGHLHQIANLLKTIARYYAKVDHATLELLRSFCKNLCPENNGLTDKNREYLRQFADPNKVSALLKLPQRLMNDAMSHDLGRRGDAVKAAFAVAIAIEVYLPIRIKNLTDLQLDQHIRRYGRKTIVSIGAESTKNSQLIEAELPEEVAELLEIYLTRFRPRLVRGPSPWLFPGEGGGRRREGGFGTQIRDLVLRETGIKMTVHQFRHFAAKLYLDRHPGALETVRRLLGHKNISTTARFYHELDTALSSRRYAQVISECLEEANSEAVTRRSAA
ncbi:MAG: site-specific integrase [Hyphomicrobiales bacterium]|nr:site-specific integrase [Hyphomicrobiales bacterium]